MRLMLCFCTLYDSWIYIWDQFNHINENPRIWLKFITVIFPQIIQSFIWKIAWAINEKWRAGGWVILVIKTPNETFMTAIKEFPWRKHYFMRVRLMFIFMRSRSVRGSHVRRNLSAGLFWRQTDCLIAAV